MDGLLLAHLCVSVLGVAAGVPDFSGDPCVSDYWYNISCVFGLGNDSVDKPQPYSLIFTPSSSQPRPAPCPLVLVGDSYHCNCQVKQSRYLYSHDKYQIQLQDGSASHDVMKDFKPAWHIKLTPPPEVEVRESVESINVTVQSEAYREHLFLSNFLQYELSLQQPRGLDTKTFSLTPGGEFMSLDRKELLKSEGEYCVKARYKPREGIPQYRATWSDWSGSICWSVHEEKEQDNKLVIVAKSVAPVCLLVAALLFVCYSPAARMKIKTLSHTPSPAPFFRPLFQQHEGNLQEWLSPEGKFLVMYPTEESVVTETVTLVVKAISKDPEELQGLINPPVTPLTVQQGQTAYVGLPGFHEAPRPPTVTVVCAGDTPYTQLPGSVWESLPDPCEGFTELSHDDSGCSLEDGSQSPEGSLPSSPGGCNDYCILNKTAEGVVPVLVSKEGGRKAPSDSLQTGE